MTPPGDKHEYIEGPLFKPEIRRYEAAGFEEVALDAHSAVHKAFWDNSELLWCRASGRGAKLKGYRVPFGSKRLGEEAVNFELLFTDDSAKRSLVAITINKFTPEALEKFKSDFGGGKC
jgi:hypothetical protein